MTALVIGYGNRLRSDDGAGPRLAEWVAARRQPDVVVVACNTATIAAIETLRADFRLVAATHKPLARMVEQGQFRQDLY